MSTTEPVSYGTSDLNTQQPAPMVPQPAPYPVAPPMPQMNYQNVVAPVMTVNVGTSHQGPLMGRIEANITIGSILGHTIIWAVLILITGGLALFFYPYSFAKLLINQCSIIDGQGRKSRLKCDLNLGDQIGHIIIWAVISIVTLGIGFFFYLFKVFNVAFNHTRIEP